LLFEKGFTLVAHYINNEEFLKAIIEHRAKVMDAKEKDLPPIQLTNYLGDCLLKIANHLSYKPNFINYSYRDEMISDGIETSLRYFNNFDPAKSSNPFAYFTQIIYYAFIRRIGTEKKQSYVKSKLIQNMDFEQFETQDHDDDGQFHNAYLDFMQANQNFDDFIERKKEKRKKKAQSNLDEFINDNSEQQQPLP
jgi:hypothetical protein